ncbi:hypothetical protein [Pseudomonas sp. R5(2019)]|uniref:hypothetical protein n=1 Tax=Pseudomonas sp. R5(2019) TaxID=2697566 RepID=UPI0014121A28|nr:hypothetical protein [Pseudomonas sp. R5(2019)]NBA95498.1 hypothetical protein [Pseudomonas sp. R5(2019)]
MSYNTGNPIGSTNPKDLFDNAKCFDSFANGPGPTYKDRLGVDRKSIPGMIAEFDQSQVARTQQFDHLLESTGYSLVGEYAPGLLIERFNQYVMKDGQPYRLSSLATVPYTTTGNWATESDAFVLLGDDVLRQDLANPDKSSALVVFMPAGVGAIGGTLLRKVRERVSVLDFMSQAMISDTQTDSPALDHLPAFLLARAHAMNTGAKLIVPAGNYRWAGSTTFEVDLGKFGFEGEGDVKIDCSAFTGSTAVHVYSSLAYPDSAYHNSANKFKGMAFIGDKILGRYGLLIGHPTFTYSGQCSIWHVTFAKFDRNVHCTHNAWRYSFWNCNFTNGLTHNWYAPAGLTNSGEVMDFFHCQLFDGTGGITLEANGFCLNLHGCSVLNIKLSIPGNSNRVVFLGGNIENPGATIYYDYLDITGTTNVVVYDGTTLIMNNPPLFTDSPFKVGANSSVVFIGITWPAGAFLFEQGSGNLSYVSGAGIAVAYGSTFQPLAGAKKPTLGKLANNLANGGFEAGTLAAWTSTTFGTAGSTAVASGAAAKLGSFGARLTSSGASAGINTVQSVAVKPGQMVAPGAWAIVVTPAGSGISGQISMAFLDVAGNVILSVAETVASASWVVVGSSMTRYAPVGSVSARVTINAQNGAVVDFDDVIINVM